MKIGSFEFSTRKGEERKKFEHFSGHTSAIELNEHVSFEKIFGKVNLYFVAKKDTGIQDWHYKDAMRRLLVVVRDDPAIQTIEANSWFVNEAPFLFKHDGFSVDGEVARISRDEFLLLNFKRYVG